ncbi:calmodulin, striated muscle-like [Ctenocephalides felis]|uniref:calmodulin, striated muscle-like n=1 Tax=Ctenocephalides felis TaxID=7515 RepID=UPI000E6E1EDE|nr:calmodulin, striated muscle-like [Ctenocephalides felis]
MPKGFDEPDVSVAKKEKLPPDVLEELRYAYDQYKNAEDLLDVSQLSNVLQILGYTPTEAELYDMIGAMDPEKSTFITYELFKEKIYDFNRRFYSEDEIQLVFRIFDQDRTGYVDFEELNRIQTNLGKE